MRRFRGIVSGVVVLLAVATAPVAAQAAPTPWSVGAAKVDTTPPAFDTAQDLQDFPEIDPARQTICPRSTSTARACGASRSPTRTRTARATSTTRYSGRGAAPPEPFCDYNHNGRWEGIYLSGGVQPPREDACTTRSTRAPSPSPTARRPSCSCRWSPRGSSRTTSARRAPRRRRSPGRAPHQASCGHIDEMVVSSNHNESSPDTVGIYGAPPDPTGTFGLNSASTSTTWTGSTSRWRRPPSMPATTAGRRRCGRSSSRSRRPRAGDPEPVPDRRRRRRRRRRSTPRCACCRRATRAATRSSR